MQARVVVVSLLSVFIKLVSDAAAGTIIVWPILKH